MEKWIHNLNYNPIAGLLRSDNEAILAFVKWDFLGERRQVENLWQLQEPQKILKKQNKNGSWFYPGGKDNIRSRENYNQIETYRNLGILVEQFGFNKEKPVISRAAEYLFSFQSHEGDFRGIYGNQYSPNYSAGITELLLKAGYEDDIRIKKVFEWFFSIRQNDGGWAIPLRTKKYNLESILPTVKTIKPDLSQPFSWMVTGVVLRAFATHSKYKHSIEAKQSGELLLSSLFKKDHYPDRSGSEYWLRFSFPFWFTDLISALDSLSHLGFSMKEPEIEKALQWFINNQQKNGLWNLKILKGRNKDVIQLWLALAICRIFKRFNEIGT